MSARTPGPLSINATVRNLPLDDVLEGHLFASDFVWVTALANLPGEHAYRREWNRLGTLLDGQIRSRVQIELPEPAPAARGHVILDGTRHDLVCAHTARLGTSADAETRWVIASLTIYRHVDPIWMIDQPADVRALLLAIESTPVLSPDATPPGPTPDGTLVRDLTTEELTETLATLLTLPADITESLVAAVDAHPPLQKPALTDLLNMAQALAQTD